jgi:RNA polymerase sigma factor (sigma-70 family)
MDRESFHQRLSAISTQWTLLFQAHRGSADSATAAQCQLMQRYSGAVLRYFMGAVRDPDVAAELSQEFALRFVRGDFRRADPQRGQFRDYLKRALIHMITDYYRARQAWPRPLDSGIPEPAAAHPESVDEKEEFLKSWREELLQRTWQALGEANPSYCAALRFRIENPNMPSWEMAAHLSRQLGKPVSAAWVRKSLERGREKFADSLVAEVAHSLEADTETEVGEELRALDLLKYCRSALQRRQRKTG